jgi:hypothetical protein
MHRHDTRNEFCNSLPRWMAVLCFKFYPILISIRKSILFILLIIFFPYTSFSQKIENIQIKQDGGKVVITYDLIGENLKVYEVAVEMSKDGGVTFYSVPKSLTGEVGKGVKEGKGKKIVWDVLRDVTELYGDNFVFKLIAAEKALDESQRVPSGGIPTWIWIGGSAAVLGGAAAVLLSGKKVTKTPELPGPDQLTWPPK